jgi:macrolide transport system ATP-binding/permease protein
MKMLRAWCVRLAGMFSRGRREVEIGDELESHVQMHVDEGVRAGMTAEEARRRAVLKLGGLEAVRQAYRERSTVPLLEHLAQDLRFALRQLRKDRWFATTAILILALGICANVAIFAFVDAALIKPLPYREPRALVGLFESNALGSQYHLSYPDYLDWKNQNKVFSSLQVYETSGLMLSTPTGVQKADAVLVSDGFFRTLGVSPLFGRGFVDGEDAASAPRTVMLSYAAWQRRYGGRRDVIGESVTLDGAPNTIIAVLPPEFHFSPAEPAEFWVTMHASGNALTCRGCHNLFGIARLKDGVSVRAAEADMKSIQATLERQYPDADGNRSATILSLNDVIVGDIRPILLVLLCGAALLLLIVCVNVSSLLLVRSERRRRETAIRSALGASRARLIRQFVTEGMLLVVSGSVLGVACGRVVMQLLTRLIPAEIAAGMPYLREAGLTPRVLLFALILSLLAGGLFSLIPILRSASPDVRGGLRDGARGSSSTVWQGFGSKLVVLELAIAVVLLVSAGLLGKSLYRLLHVDLGLQPDHLALLRVGAHGGNYAKDQQQIALAQQIVARVDGLPGVRAAAITSDLPVGDGDGITQFQIAGRPLMREHNETNTRRVSAEYFAALQARLLRGRYFSEREDQSKPLVAIINRRLAEQYFAGEDPIGRQISVGDSKMTEIVGVVDDIKEGPLDMAIRPAVYTPFSQTPDDDFGIIVRTAQAEGSLLPEISDQVHQIDPGLSTFGGVTMSDRIDNSPTAYFHRSSAWLVGWFAGMALLLGVVGLYGVIAYSVSQRTHEIGVRMALGAQRASVYRLVLREAGWLIGVGIAAGLICSTGATMLLRNLLFGVRGWDLATLVTVAGTLGFFALLASYFPARRAASVNPVEALRAE